MTLKDVAKTPFPWFGGKTHAAPQVWEALGDVPHYVEPFFGGGAVLLRRPHLANRTYYSETVNDLDGLLCLDPSARVLTESLSWKPIGEVKPGDKLIAFDEHNPSPAIGFGAPKSYRKMAVATAIATAVVKKRCYRLLFSDGTEVVASEDHQWLSGSHKADSGGRAWRWIKTKNMVPVGQRKNGQRSWVLKVCDVQEQEATFDAGWMSGFLDGEGNTKPPPGWSVNCSQKVSPESERYGAILSNRGYQLARSCREPRSAKHQPQDVWVLNGMRQVLRLMMQFRPERLLRNMVERISERSLYGREHSAVYLVEKEPVGEREVVALETDTHTYIAEGLASHNCNAWRSIQFSPQATAEAASWPVSEFDKHARSCYLLKWRESEAAAKLAGDPMWHDPVMGGWWLWCVCVQIGAWGQGGPWWPDEEGKLRKRPRGCDKGEAGVLGNLPRLGNNGQGVNHAGTREPGVGGEEPNWEACRDADYEATGGYHPLTMPELRRWFAYLSARLRHVRIVNGDWTRVVTTGAACNLPVRQGKGPCGVFLDPPYGDVGRASLYGKQESLTVAEDVRAWCLQHGDDERFRIVYAGFDEEGADLEAAGWRVVEWYQGGHLRGGMGNLAGSGGHQQHRERLWLSPHCLGAKQQAQRELF